MTAWLDGVERDVDWLCEILFSLVRLYHYLVVQFCQVAYVVKS